MVRRLVAYICWPQPQGLVNRSCITALLALLGVGCGDGVGGASTRGEPWGRGRGDGPRPDGQVDGDEGERTGRSPREAGDAASGSARARLVVTRKPPRSCCESHRVRRPLRALIR